MDTGILAWTLLALAVTLSPGPDTFLVLGSAMRGGTRAGLAATAGIVSGFFFYAALCGFGFLSLLVASPLLHDVVQIAGALYLTWIGIGMLRNALWRQPADGDAPADKTITARRTGIGAAFRHGLLSNALNPKIAVFYLAALPQFAGNGPDAPMTGVLLILIHYVLGGLWLSSLAVAGGRAGHQMRGGNLFRWLNGVIGVSLIGLAARMAWERR
jgi:threonine/homoserine/homoserine lactone efflux protein